MATKLEGVRTVFPSGPNAGQPADRYTSYDEIPILKRIGAQQLGGAGFWYVRANLGARLRREWDVVSGQFVQVVDEIRQGAEGLVSGAGKWVLLGGVVYLVGAYLSRGRRA